MTGTNLFQGYTVTQNDQDLLDKHTIVCDDPYMQQLGLGSFTTGTLYDWCSRTNYADEYVNLKLIEFPKSNLKPSGTFDRSDPFIFECMKTILHGGLNPPSMKFSPFRKEDRGGSYKDFYSSSNPSNFIQTDWTSKDGYNQSTLDSADFYNKRVDIKQIQTNSFDIELIQRVNFDTALSNLIEMNNWVDIYPSIYTNEAFWTVQYKARKQFINDIKSSKYKCLKWTSSLTFNLDLSVGKCKKTQSVNFKLFLFDQKNQKKTARKLTINNPMIVSPPITVTGRTGTLQDGELSQTSSSNPAQQVASQLDTYYDAFSGKIKAGSKQIIGQLTTDIEAAQPVSLNDNLVKKVTDLLLPSMSHSVKFGYAMPITMQNANPFLWSPEYKNPKGCRGEEDLEKHTVRVMNPFPRTWKAGDIVILNEVNGMWVPTTFGEAEPQSISFNEQKWQFTYLMTNSEHYFRNNKQELITPATYKAAVRNYYYFNDDLNGDTSINTTNYQSLVNNLDLKLGYFQVTSWDFMGPSIGGLRPTGNALACTQFAFNPKDEALENGGQFLEGTQSAPFFGCVFPDGYEPGDKYGSYKNSHGAFVAKSISNTDVINANYFYMRDIASNVNLFNNVNANLSPSAAGGMFIKSQGSNNDPSLKHLPADIALNASPSGTYGCPIKNILSYYNNINYGTGNVTQFRNRLKNLLTDGQYWMAKTSDAYSSVFDFKPTNALKIQFRPLKGEVYTTFEHKNWDSVVAQQPNQRGEYGAYSWRLVNDQQSPISLAAYSRNTLSLNNQLIGPSGLNYQALILNETKDAVSSTLPPSTSRFPQTWWNTKNWQKTDPLLGGQPRPAGGIGVITAQCTVKALSKITFSTTNYLGITSWFGQSASITIFNTLVVPPKPWYASWGPWGGDSVSSMQTTSLFAKIYQAWPREQTIFDPRFFTVFHFNSSSDSLIYQQPTSSTGTGALVNKDSLVFSDQWTFAAFNGNFKPKDQWIKNSDRKDKLLPYKYKTTTISLDFSTFWLAEIESNKAQPKDCGVYIKNRGTGYRPDDIFKVSGGSGTSINLRPQVNNGMIIGFELADVNDEVFGYGYAPEDFANFNLYVDDQLSTLKVKILPVSTLGSGFEGYVVRGIIKEKTLSDDGPKEIVSSLKLTPLPKATSTPTEAVVDPVADSVEQTVLIDSSSTSSDNKYDIFLHFHNDISHTMAHDHVGGGPVALENHCTLEILPA